MNYKRPVTVNWDFLEELCGKEQTKWAKVKLEVKEKTDKELLEIIRDLNPYMSNAESARRDAALIEIERRK